MDTYNPSKLTAAPKKVDISLRQLADFDATGGDRDRVDNVKSNQVLVSLSNFNRPKTFSFQYISDLLQGGTGISISTDKDGITSITNTGVTKIIAGTNISISPVTGVGNVTITNTASSSLAVGTTPITGGTVGRILFEGTGNVLQESANFFWDNTNSRLGIGTALPSYGIDIAGAIGAASSIRTGWGVYSRYLINPTATGTYIEFQPSVHQMQMIINGTDAIRIPSTRNVLIGTTTDAGYKLDVNGTARVSGALTAALSANAGSNPNLLVQTTNGDSSVLRVQNTEGFGLITTNNGVSNLTNNDIALSFQNGIVGFRIGAGGGGIGPNSSAILDIVSTNRGFLPPRMTTTEKNAIASPAAGLVVYDTTLGKLCVRGASAWETITSV